MCTKTGLSGFIMEGRKKRKKSYFSIHMSLASSYILVKCNGQNLWSQLFTEKMNQPNHNSCWRKMFCQIHSFSSWALEDRVLPWISGWPIRWEGWGRNSLVGRASDWKARHNTDTGLSRQCSKEFPPQESTTSRADFLSVRTAPVHNRTHQRLCAC